MKQQQQLLLLAACAAFALLAATASAEFIPSIVLTTVKEMENNCEHMVDNALALGSKEIKFVPTVHFYGSETNINSYCFRCEHQHHSIGTDKHACMHAQQQQQQPAAAPVA